MKEETTCNITVFRLQIPCHAHLLSLHAAMLPAWRVRDCRGAAAVRACLPVRACAGDSTYGAYCTAQQWQRSLIDTLTQSLGREPLWSRQPCAADAVLPQLAICLRWYYAVQEGMPSTLFHLHPVVLRCSSRNSRL